MLGTVMPFISKLDGGCLDMPPPGRKIRAPGGRFGHSDFDCNPDLATPSTEEKMRSGRLADRGINNLFISFRWKILKHC